MPNLCFVTSCVAANGYDINEMKDSPLANQIDKETFFETVGAGIKDCVIDMFNLNNIQDFINDWHTDTCSSYYQGVPCLYVTHSNIEFIFVDKNRICELKFDDEAEDRWDAINAIEDKLDHYEPWQQAGTKAEWYLSLSNFVKENLNDFNQHNILLSSIFNNHSRYREVVADIDKKLLIEPRCKSKESSLSL